MTVDASANDGADRITGGAGNDRIFGNEGNDFINGDAGNDIVNGNAGDDTIDGGAGDDDIFGDSGLFIGTLANPAVGGIAPGGGPGAELNGPNGLNGLAFDNLGGADGDDTILGGAGDDNIFGGLGRDAISGQVGSCLLYTSPSPRDQRGSRMPSSA